MRLRKTAADDVKMDSDMLVALGRRITEARLEAGMTKMELAEKIGVPLGTFERFEAGGEDPSPHLDQLAKVTGKPIAWFKGGDGASAPVAPEPEAPPVEAPPVEAEAEAAPEPPAPLPIEPEPEPAPVAEAPPAEAPAAEAVPAPPLSPPAAGGEDEDELDRMLSTLGKQREQIKSLRAELAERTAQLDARERELAERETRQADLDAQGTARFGEIQREWDERLKSFEDTNRQYAEAANSLADWAAELRKRLSGEPEEAPAAPEPEAEPEPEPAAVAEGDDFPEDF